MRNFLDVRSTITGNGSTVDFDHVKVKASTLLTPPVLTVSAADLTLYSYAGTTLATPLDLSASDPGVDEVLTYQADNPQAAMSHWCLPRVD